MEKDEPQNQEVDLFHSSTEVDQQALYSLSADADAAGVELHVMVDAQHGRLTGERLRAKVPEWRQASIWFCGPAGAGFGEVRGVEARSGRPWLPLSVSASIVHQELFPCAAEP